MLSAVTQSQHQGAIKAHHTKDSLSVKAQPWPPAVHPEESPLDSVGRNTSRYNSQHTYTQKDF